MEENKLNEVIYYITLKFSNEPKENILEAILDVGAELFFGDFKDKIEFDKRIIHYFKLRNCHGNKKTNQ